MKTNTFAQACGFDERAAYRPVRRPGHTAWVSLFPFGNGDLGLAFLEIRRGKNHSFEPIPLDFVEAMSLVYRETPDLLPASNKDLISEYVCLRSKDQGRTWQETGRCPADTRHYWYVGFPEGRIVRVVATQHYRYELGADRLCSVIEESHDGGSTWTEIARIMPDKFFYVHKFKKLADDRILAVGPILPSFGPETEIPTRSYGMPSYVHPHQSAFLVTEDGGKTWDGPHYVLPGIEAWEPDFVELSDGAVLFINSSVQAGKAVRQIVRQTANGWVNEPMFEIRRGAPTDDNIQGGFTPESVCITTDGLIVGARRGHPYSCSQDLGENWYEVEGAPRCNYQPIIEALPNGRFLCAWHLGGDTRFGEIDMYIGLHEFALQACMPKATMFTLERELSPDRRRYINAFRARLTVGETPVPHQALSLHVKDAWLPQPDGRKNSIDIWHSPDVRQAVTDEQGDARFALADKDAIPDIHHGYSVAVSFVPQSGGQLAACRGPTRSAFALTPARGDPAPYPIYLNHNILMITPQTAERFPDLEQVAQHFNLPDPDRGIDFWIAAFGTRTRAEQILALLLENHVVTQDSEGIYHWYRAVHGGGPGEPWITEMRVCDLEEHCI